MAIAHGDRRFVAIPVFTSRSFFHTGILVRSYRGIETPQDLKGMKVAVPEYQQTAALWCRGALQHEFGDAPLDIDWYVTVLDLGAWGALYTEGWDRKVRSTGAAAKETKMTINRKRIYPPLNGSRADLLAAAAPAVQTAPKT